MMKKPEETKLEEREAGRSPIFQMVPIEKLQEASFSDRSFYNLQKMQELIESIRQRGVLTPLLVRPTDGAQNGDFEIAAGRRRYRAAKEVGLIEVPAIIRVMTDVEFLEIVTIENILHEDVHPLDEASGYQRLIERAGYDVAAISAKVSKSPSYVYQRLKLLDLIPNAKGSFLKEAISAGHAVLIARLQPKEQEQALKAALGGNDRFGIHRDSLSTRSLATYIEEEIHLDLNSAGFSKKDPDLVPEAGPCTTCPKRTGFQPELFPDIKKQDTCTDPTCFQKKVAVYLQQRVEEAKKESDGHYEVAKLSTEYGYNAKKEQKDVLYLGNYTEIGRKDLTCEHAQKGVVVDGKNKGRILTVCADPKCPTHRSQGRYRASPEERERKKESNRREKIEAAVRDRILDETLAAWPKEPGKEEWEFLAEQLFEELWFEYQKKILARHEIEPKKLQYGLDTKTPIKQWIKKQSKPELIHFLFEMALIRNIATEELRDHAKRLKVDIKTVEKEVREGFKKKEAKPKKKSKTQKPSTKKSEGCICDPKGRPDQQRTNPYCEAKHTENKPDQPGVCRVCGCTNETPCEDGGFPCRWVDKEKTLCSACAGKNKKPKTKTKKVSPKARPSARA
jgi:ParB family chromosome partitioning protein